MERYQDYVIKDGKFIGKFEEMYQKFDNPWYQIEDAESSYSKHATLLTLKNFGIESVLEVGCGLGTFTNHMSRSFPHIRFKGIDVSETAIQKAKEKYPHIEFIHDNFLNYLKNLSDNDEKMDAVLLAECMWYILEDLDEIISLLSEKYSEKYLLINQTFYKGKQKYGTEYFKDLDGMIKYLPFKMIRKMETETADENDAIDSHSIFVIE